MNIDMKKQTAVEWLLDQLEQRKLIALDKHSTIIFHRDFSTPYDLIVHQAKAMEKEQIIDAYNYGQYNYEDPLGYYNETYVGDK